MDDALGNMIIGAFAIAVTSWSFISMFADNMINTCGFGFKSWSCAGFTSTWLAAWIVGGVEAIVWTIAMLVPSFRPIWAEIANIWTPAPRPSCCLVDHRPPVDKTPFTGAL